MFQTNLTVLIGKSVHSNSAGVVTMVGTALWSQGHRVSTMAYAGIAARKYGEFSSFVPMPTDAEMDAYLNGPLTEDAEYDAYVEAYGNGEHPAS